MGGRYAHASVSGIVALYSAIENAQKKAVGTPTAGGPPNCFSWLTNVSRETFLALIFLLFPAFSVLVALIGGWTIQPKCRFFSQPIGIRGFYFALSFF